MKAKKNREINIISLSFMDVLANTIGGLAFLLILAVLMTGALVFSSPKITTEKLEDGYDQQPYQTWLGAREGLGRFEWSFGEGERPAGLSLDPHSGELAGQPKLPEKVNEKRYKFAVVCKAQSEDTQGQPSVADKWFEMTVHRDPRVLTKPLNIITETTLPDAYLKSPYPLVFAAEGGQAPYTWTWSGSDLPAGLTLASDGKLTGQPTVARTYPFAVKVETPTGVSQEKNFRLTVTAPLKVPPLKLKTRDLPDARAGMEYKLAIAVEGGQPPFKWTCKEQPPGASMKVEDGMLKGTPEGPGKIDLAITVTDEKGQTDLANLSLRTRPSLGEVQIQTLKAPPARVGLDYDLALAATGGYSPYTWRLNGDLPPGLTFAEGRVSGKPTNAGQWAINLAVSDAEATTAANDVELKLAVLTAEGVQPLAITTQALPTLLNGDPSEITLACEGGTGPYQWQATGALPDGLKLEGSRLVGTPTQSGQHSFEVSVTDSSGQTAAAPLTVTVRRMSATRVVVVLVILLTALLAFVALAVRSLRQAHRRSRPVPLRITTQSLPNARASFPYELQLACEGGVLPYRWRIAEGDLPPGMDLTADGKLHGKPFEGVGVDATREVTFVVEVKDDTGTTARQQL